jgi:quercetin dioxygenase-like cupin family protein
MALVHAQPLDVISLRPLAAQLHEVKTHSLLKTDKLQLMRLVLAAGQNVPEHHVPGEITIQCLEGEVLVSISRRACPLAAGELLALPAHEPHGLQAISDASLLVTILLHQSS